MSRLIDADVLIEILTTAIRNMKGMAKFLNAEDDPEIKMEIKAYTDILNGVKEQPTIELDLKWIPVTEKLPEPCDTKTENVLNSNWTIYSDRVKTELETQGITTRELADKLNITPITMHRYLKGDRIPRGPVIAQTATVLNVTCDYLVGLSDDPHKTSEEK